MNKIRSTFVILGFLSISICDPIGMAADYPQNPIRMIIAASAGGGNDTLARAFQPAFERVLGQKMIIQCMPGGNQKIGTMELMNAKPDGYTLILMPADSWISRYYSKTYDSKIWEQVVPIGNLTSEPYGFIEVRSESPFKTWADLVKTAKENPGKLTCGLPGIGSMHELILNDITKAAGIKTRDVPFAGAGPTNVALLGGHVDFRVCQPTEAITMIRAGKTRGLAVSTDKRMESIPDVPTFKELGIGGTIEMNRAIWGPPKLPSALVNTLTKVMEKAMKDPDFIKIVHNQLLYTVDYRPPQKMIEDAKEFDKEFGPKLTEIFKK